MKARPLLLTILLATAPALYAQNTNELEGRRLVCQNYNPEPEPIAPEHQFIMDFLPENKYQKTQFTSIVDPNIAIFKSAQTGNWRLENKQLTLTNLTTTNKEHHINHEVLTETQNQATNIPKEEQIHQYIIDTINTAKQHFDNPPQEITLQILATEDDKILFGVENGRAIGLDLFLACGNPPE